MGRWGILPFNIQNILQTNNKNCFINEQEKLLKENNICFLRQGVEKNKNQSFISCIANIYGKIRLKDKIIPTIVQMKEIIINIEGDNGAKKIINMHENKTYVFETNDQSIIQDFNTQESFS